MRRAALASARSRRPAAIVLGARIGARGSAARGRSSDRPGRRGAARTNGPTMQISAITTSTMTLTTAARLRREPAQASAQSERPRPRSVGSDGADAGGRRQS